MSFLFKRPALVAVAALSFSTALASAHDNGQLSVQEQQVVDLLKVFEGGPREAISAINPDKYIQHNPHAPDGVAGFEGYVAAVESPDNKVNTVRVFEDGDYVIAHSQYDFASTEIGIDIFRFENGQIVEHWDNLQAPPEGETPSGNSMVDGASEVTDFDKTEANKALVRNFVDEILVKGQVDKLASYFDGDSYIQHNPQIGNGVSGLTAALAEMTAAGVTMEYDTVHAVFGEGNFVLAVSEGKLGGEATSFYDIFRVENGKIAEHWDTVETILPDGEWQNENGKFGF